MKIQSMNQLELIKSVFAQVENCSSQHHKVHALLMKQIFVDNLVIKYCNLLLT